MHACMDARLWQVCAVSACQVWQLCVCVCVSVECLLGVAAVCQLSVFWVWQLCVS